MFMATDLKHEAFFSGHSLEHFCRHCACNHIHRWTCWHVNQIMYCADRDAGCTGYKLLSVYNRHHRMDSAAFFSPRKRLAIGCSRSRTFNEHKLKKCSSVIPEQSWMISIFWKMNYNCISCHPAFLDTNNKFTPFHHENSSLWCPFQI